MTISPIIVGLDGSAAADHALSWAHELAARSGAPIRAVLSWDLPAYLMTSSLGSDVSPIPAVEAAADDGIACTVAIQRALARHRGEHGFAPSLRIGLHAGEATSRDGDYFGSAVTRAARISAAAGAGEVLASADLVAGCRHEVPVAGERTLELKGIAEPVVAVLVTWDAAAENQVLHTPRRRRSHRGGADCNCIQLR